MRTRVLYVRIREEKAQIGQVGLAKIAFLIS